MTYSDLWDNQSLMKLYNIETEAIQRMYGFPTYTDNKGVSEQRPEQKSSPSNG